jgi:DNA-binding transcriptional LysR family regulator
LEDGKAQLLSLQQLRCFCAAAQLGSFTAAAEALGVSQPAVADQIRKLERALGADVFFRAGRGVVPTEAGHAFTLHATQALRSVEDAAASVGELTSLRRGTVALGAFNVPGPWRLHEPLSSFLTRHPGVAVRLVGRNSSRTAELVRLGRLEAAIVVLPVDDDKLDVRPLARDEVLYVSADAGRTTHPVTIEQLAGTPLIFYDAESADADPIRRQLADRAQADGLTLRPRVEVDSMDLALRLVADGLGDTYLPSAYTRAPSYPEDLTTASFAPAIHDTFAVITRRAARLSLGVRELIGELAAHMQDIAAELDRSR